MNFKTYIKTEGKTVFIQCLPLHILMILCFLASLSASYTVIESTLYGKQFEIYIAIGCYILAIMLFVMCDYKHSKKVFAYNQQEYEKEKEFYKNLTFNDFVNRLYEDDELDLDLMGCPEDYDDEQSKDWLKNYIKKIVKENNNNENCDS